MEPNALTRAFNSCFRAAQRGKVLSLQESIVSYYAISSDATGFLHSEKVNCENYCEKHHRDSRISYYHQILSAVMVSPDRQEFLPLSLEPIVKQNGTKKNDCKTNSSKRLSTTLRKIHPNLKILALENALYGNAPHLNLLKSLGVRCLINAKPRNHKWLFSWVNARQCAEFKLKDKHNEYEFRFIIQVPLNE